MDGLVSPYKGECMNDLRTIVMLQGTEKEEVMSLYNELGQYFAANGSFDEYKFGEVLSNHIDTILRKGLDNNQIILWISDYIGGIMKYLEAKEMMLAATKLFRVALEKSKVHRVKNLTLSPEILERMLNFSLTIKVEEDQKNKNIDEKKNLIFQASLKLFSSKGFHKTTMDEIASQSGVGKGSLYRYFKSKDELLDTLLEEQYGNIVSNIADLFNNSEDIIDGLVKMIDYWVRFINDNPVVYTLIQSTDITKSKLGGKSRFYKYMSDHLPLLKARIVSLDKDSKVKGIDYLTVIFGIFGFIDGVFLKWSGSGMNYSLTDEIPVILETLFNGCVGETKTQRKFVNENNQTSK